MTIQEIFTKRLIAERERRGWSQAELSRRVTALGHNLKKDAMSKIERGGREVTLKDAVALAAALNVPLPALLFDFSSDELALTPELRVRLTFAAAWFVGRIPLTRDDVKHFRAAQVMFARANAIQDELADYLAEQPPNEHEVEMLRGLARTYRARAGFFEAVADLPDAPDAQKMRDEAQKLRKDADEIEQLLPEEKS
jgi:transcriptional regulator with XRE-family HTH domain